MTETGRIILLSGPSGVGKDTLLDIVFKLRPSLVHSVSVTTRAKRDHEVHGKDYYFISFDEFERMRSDGEVLEFNKYGENYYATPKKPVDKLLSEGKDVVLKIDVNGTLNIKKLYKDNCISIFIMPPSLEELKQRLIGRGTETNEQVIQRLEIAVDELKKSSEYDYRVVNDNLEKAAAEIVAILDKK
ncbi:MAG: guanylate kinase [Clostridia bacterium]|nr:guanylate kinase [Clostridia bacterium]